MIRRDKQIADLIYILIPNCYTGERCQVTEMVGLRATGEEIPDPVNPVADDPVLLQPGLTLPGFSREEAVAAVLIDSTQRKESQDIIAVLGNDKVGPVIEVSVEAVTHLPEVRQIVGGHNLLPDSFALFQI